MRELSDSFAPDRIRADPDEVIIAASDTFQLWQECKRAACRRAGGCRGMEAGKLPRCTLRLMLRCRIVFDAIRAFLPPRAGQNRTFDEKLDRIQMRMADLMERQLDAMEKQETKRSAGSAR